jgi:hypothetical protein
MTEKDQLIKEKLDHTGIFDFKGFYAFAYKWLRDENYGVLEEKYSEKVSGNARDISIEWKAVKKISDYFKIEIGVKFEVSGLTDVEVETDGKKKKTNKGKVAIEIKGTMVRDPDSRWEETPTWRFMRDLYNKYIVPSRVDNLSDKIFADVQGYKTQLKSYLDLLGRT